MLRRPATLLRKVLPSFKRLNAGNTSKIGFKLLAGFVAVGVSSYLYRTKNKEETSLMPIALAEEDDMPQLKNIQPTIISGMHPQCAIVTIHISTRANKKDVARAVSKLESLVQQISPQEKNVSDQDEDDRLPDVIAGAGFSSSFWNSLTGTQYPVYKSRKGKYGSMPFTGGDVILHVKASSRSLCHEVVDEFVRSLPVGSVVRVDDNYGWKYKEGRDLSGFLDGTMNPAGTEERYAAAVIPNTGGSFLLHQVWSHNIPKLNNLDLETQEAMVGRKKETSAELTNLHAESHVARMRRNGKDAIIPIVRQSMPFGSIAGPNGLLFIAYSNTLEKFDTMLDRMTGVDGHNDATMTYSTCVTGNYYYIPSKKELSAL